MIAASSESNRPSDTNDLTNALMSLGKLRFMTSLQWAGAHNMVFTQRTCGRTFNAVLASFLLYNQIEFNPPSLRLRRRRNSFYAKPVWPKG